jgi:hypothetical protein
VSARQQKDANRGVIFSRDEKGANMVISWTIAIALILIFLKQVYKLYLFAQPDRIDYLKTAAALPIDISFLVVSLFIRRATQGAQENIEEILGLLVAYVVISALTTILWRVCENAVTPKLGTSFFWAFPLNTALAGTTFYFALNLLR